MVARLCGTLCPGGQTLGKPAQWDSWITMLLNISKLAHPGQLRRAACSLLPSSGVLIAFLLFVRSASATTFPIRMTDFAFTPASQTGSVGDTVTWNGVSDSHTVTSGSGGVADGVWDSGNVDQGSS